MAAAKDGRIDGGEKGLEGVVVSHAGSGSILDALRVDVPLIVVPNESLLDNHQNELAEELARQDLVVHGRMDKLAEALEKAEGLREKKRRWPPQDDTGRLPTGRSKGLAGIMDDEMGFVD